MNFIIDGILMLFFLVLLYISFDNGILKVATVLLGMYLGLQIAGLFYEPFAGLTATAGDPESKTTSDIVWFFVLWAIFSIVFALVVWSIIGTFALPKWAGNIDQLGGLILGAFAGILFLTVVVFVMKNTTTMMWYGSGKPQNWLGGIVSGFENSFLVRILNIFRELFLNFLSPWLPRTLPALRDKI
jgi:uncharacterized membrane protein required for colicin V production